VATVSLGWEHLNAKGKLAVAKAYHRKDIVDFETNENYDLYPTFELEVAELCPACDEPYDECKCNDKD